MRRSLAFLLVLCACSGGGGGGSTAGPPAPPPANGAVSGASPFPASCGGGGGTLYVDAEVEPHIAIDPRDPNHLVGAWQQDRWDNGSARGIVTGASFDGGATWTIGLPAFTACAGGPDQRGTDPWVAIASDGTAHVMALTTTGGTFEAGSTNAILAARSLDGGRTWLAPVTVLRDGAGFFSDKETMTADPNDARFLYAAWDRLVQGAGGPTMFARSTDGGVSWEPARVIRDFGPDGQSIGNLIRVLPNGTLVNVYTFLRGDEDSVDEASIQVMRSTDRGVTWSASVTVSDFRGMGARTPGGMRVRDGSIIPQMAVAPNGNLYVVWQDARFTGARDAIAMSRSTDGGLTWSAPARVNSNPQVSAFTPSVHVRADGVVGVTYFDFRSDPGTGALTEYWLARSADAGATWSETRVAAPFNLGTAPLVGGALFLGDYMGLASAGTTFLPFYTRTIGGPFLTDVFFTRMADGAASVAEPVVDPKSVREGAQATAAALAHAQRERRARLLR